MAQKHKQNDGALVKAVLAIIAIAAGLLKGIADGIGPPPGDRRG